VLGTADDNDVHALAPVDVVVSGLPFTMISTVEPDLTAAT